MLCPGPILVAALASATPAAPVEPLGGAAPASAPAPAATPTPTSAEVAAPLARPGPASSPTTAAPAGSGPAPVATPFGGEVPGPPPAPADPRKQLVIRPEFLIGPVWRIQTTEVLTLANLEVGWLQGFSGTFHAGIIIAPDRDIIAAVDFPIGAGFIYRHRLGKRPLYGSVGLSAGVLVHRAGTDRGVVVRVDPDLQLPLRFAWTAGPVGLSIVLLQGFSGRSRTYERRGAEVWHRIPYRIGITVGIHFNIGVARKQSRRAAPGSKVPS